MQNKKKIILASKSPRRKKLLTAIGLKFKVHPSSFKEKEGGEQLDNKPFNPKAFVLHNAMGKAKNTAEHYKNALILGVDTIGVVGNHLIGKPKNRKDAKRILRLLSDTTHKVLSGICIIDTTTNKQISAVETTLVTIDKLTDKEMDSYIDSGEGKDKAAGYAIQGIGALYVKKINGDFYNVVGLPINRLRKMLQKMGVKISN